MSLYEKLMNIQSELKAPKSQFNKFGNYQYRNNEDILEALKPLLLKYKATIRLSDEIEQVGNRYYVKVTARFTDAEDGQYIDAVAYAREADSQKGMSESQLTGSASSYARKYALNGLFAIDDTKDSDFTNDDELGNGKLATENQLKLLYSLVKQKKYEDSIVSYIDKQYSKKSSKELTRSEASEIIDMLNGLGK